MKLTVRFHENNKVFSANFGEVHAVSDGGYRAGRYDEWSAFWDIYQNGGARVFRYPDHFVAGWSNTNFKPKYPIIVGRGTNMFSRSSISNPEYTRKIDVSQSIKNDVMFLYAKIVHLASVDVRNSTDNTEMFYGCSELETIETLILKEDGTSVISNMFGGDVRKLINIAVSGKIGNHFKMESPVLSKDSIRSIVNALLESATGKTLTLSRTAVNAAFETSSGANDGSTSEEWLAWIGAKRNWTITLS